MPGSETLWSVHSGQRVCTKRLASSTRPWKVRSSRLGAGNISDLQLGRGVDGAGQLLVGDHVERKDQVARVVAADDLVCHVDVYRPSFDPVVAHADLLDHDAGLP